MRSQLQRITSLLTGMSVVLIGSGLLGTVLPVRAQLEGFSELAIGVVMASYYVGFILGTIWCPRIVRRVGHIRAFAIFAAIATVCILAHGVLVIPAVWAALRTLVGAGLIGIYITVESWLNDRADRSNRGRVFAIYEIAGLLALAMGQFLITIGDLMTPLPFIMAAGLFALGVIPVAWTKTPEPKLSESARLTVGRLYAISPVAVVGTLAGAVAAGGFFSMGPLVAYQLGLSEAGIATFMSAVLIGGAALQWPIGSLSDRVDRRLVIAGAAASGGIAALVMWMLAGRSLPALLLATFVYGGMIFVLYALCVAHANDLLSKAQFLDAARGFNFTYGVGAAVAPVALGMLMSTFGRAGLFVSSAALLLMLSVFALVRALSQPVPPTAVREEFVTVTAPAAEALQMYPHTPLASEGDDAPESTN